MRIGTNRRGGYHGWSKLAGSRRNEVDRSPQNVRHHNDVAVESHSGRTIAYANRVDHRPRRRIDNAEGVVEFVGHVDEVAVECNPTRSITDRDRCQNSSGGCLKHRDIVGARVRNIHRPAVVGDSLWAVADRDFLDDLTSLPIDLENRAPDCSGHKEVATIERDRYRIDVAGIAAQRNRGRRRWILIPLQHGDLVVVDAVAVASRTGWACRACWSLWARWTGLADAWKSSWASLTGWSLWACHSGHTTRP